MVNFNASHGRYENHPMNHRPTSMLTNYSQKPEFTKIHELTNQLFLFNYLHIGVNKSLPKTRVHHTSTGKKSSPSYAVEQGPYPSNSQLHSKESKSGI